MNTGFGLDVDRLLAETPAPLFEEWRTLFAIEPWGEDFADELHAEQCSVITIASPNIKAISSDKFRRRGDVPEEEPQTEEEMQAAFAAVCETMANIEAERSAATKELG